MRPRRTLSGTVTDSSCPLVESASAHMLPMIESSIPVSAPYGPFRYPACSFAAHLHESLPKRRLVLSFLPGRRRHHVVAAFLRSIHCLVKNPPFSRFHSPSPMISPTGRFSCRNWHCIRYSDLSTATQ